MLSATANEMEIINSVYILSKMLYNYHQKPVMLFIDEYIVGIENNEDNIWGLMLGTGYCTYLLKIPILMI